MDSQVEERMGREHTLSLINPPADFRGRGLRLPVWD